MNNCIFHISIQIIFNSNASIVLYNYTLSDIAMIRYYLLFLLEILNKYCFQKIRTLFLETIVSSVRGVSKDLPIETDSNVIRNQLQLPPPALIAIKGFVLKVNCDNILQHLIWVEGYLPVLQT